MCMTHGAAWTFITIWAADAGSICSAMTAAAFIQSTDAEGMWSAATTTTATTTAAGLTTTTVMNTTASIAATATAASLSASMLRVITILQASTDGPTTRGSGRSPSDGDGEAVPGTAATATTSGPIRS